MMHHRAGLAARKSYGGDTADAVARFMPLVKKLAWHLSGSAGPTVDVEDLMQAGLVALTECVQRHEGPGWDGFAAYAKLRVRGAMVDLLRSSSADARAVRMKRRQMQEAQTRLQNVLGREPTMVELAALLGLSVEDTHRLRAEAASVSVDSIEECYSDSDSAFASDLPDAEEVLLQAEDREGLIAAITALPERLQLVIQLYFVEELNLSEIAAVMDVSVPRIHQLKASALAKLRAALAES